MKSKLISAIIWIILTGIYIFTFWDSGRSIGAQANSAMEDYTKYYAQEYNSTQEKSDKIEKAWSYSYFDDLSKRYKETFTGLAVATVIYTVATVACFKFAFKKTK